MSIMTGGLYCRNKVASCSICLSNLRHGSVVQSSEAYCHLYSGQVCQLLASLVVQF